MDNLPLILESINGIDISFDSRLFQGSKDAVPNQDNTDFAYVSGIQALAQELQRLFDLTPTGSCLGDRLDLEYGIDWDFVGMPNDPRVTIALTQVAVLKALQHPRFVDRFRVADLSVTFDPQEPNALRVGGILECYGFEGVDAVRFGPYAVRRAIGQ